MNINVPTLPDEAIQFTRLFNGLSGGEVQAMILRRLKEHMANDTRLGDHISHGAISWRVKVDIITQPAYNDHIDIEDRGGFIQVDEDGNWEGVKPEDTQWPRCIFIPVSLESGLVDRPDEIRREIGVEPPVVSKRKGFPRDEGIKVEIDDGLDDAMRNAIAQHKPKNHVVVEESPLAKGAKVQEQALLPPKERIAQRLAEMTAEEILADDSLSQVVIDKDMSMSQVEKERRADSGRQYKRADGTVVEDMDELHDKAAKAAQDALEAMGPGKIVKPQPGVDTQTIVGDNSTTTVVEPEVEDEAKSQAILKAMEANGDLPPEPKKVTKPKVTKPKAAAKGKKKPSKASLDMIKDMAGEDNGTDSTE